MVKQKKRTKKSIEERNKSNQNIFVARTIEDLEKMLPGLKKLREEDAKKIKGKYAPIYLNKNT